MLLYHRQLTLRGKPGGEAYTLLETSSCLALIPLVNSNKLLIVDKVTTLTTENVSMRKILIDVVGAVLVKVIGDVSTTAEEDAVKTAEEVSGGGADITKTIQTPHTTSVASYRRAEVRIDRLVVLHAMLGVVLGDVRTHIHHFSFTEPCCVVHGIFHEQKIFHCD